MLLLKNPKIAGRNNNVAQRIWVHKKNTTLDMVFEENIKHCTLHQYPSAQRLFALLEESLQDALANGTLPSSSSSFVLIPVKGPQTETLSQVFCWDQFSNFHSLLFQKFATLTIWVFPLSISGKAEKKNYLIFPFCGYRN